MYDHIKFEEKAICSFDFRTFMDAAVQLNTLYFSKNKLKMNSFIGISFKGFAQTNLVAFFVYALLRCIYLFLLCFRTCWNFKNTYFNEFFSIGCFQLSLVFL